MHPTGPVEIEKHLRCAASVTRRAAGPFPHQATCSHMVLGTVWWPVSAELQEAVSGNMEQCEQQCSLDSSAPFAAMLPISLNVAFPNFERLFWAS